MTTGGYASMDPQLPEINDPSVRRVKLNQVEKELLDTRILNSKSINNIKIFHMSLLSLYLLGGVGLLILLIIIAGVTFFPSLNITLLVSTAIGGTILGSTLLTLIWLFQGGWKVDRVNQTVSYRAKFKKHNFNFSDITKFHIDYDTFEGTDLNVFALKVGTQEEEISIPLIYAVDRLISSDPKSHWVILKEIIQASSLAEGSFNEAYIDVKPTDTTIWNKGKALNFIDSIIVSD